MPHELLFAHTCYRLQDLLVAGPVPAAHIGRPHDPVFSRSVLWVFHGRNPRGVLRRYIDPHPCGTNMPLCDQCAYLGAAQNTRTHIAIQVVIADSVLVTICSGPCN